MRDCESNHRLPLLDVRIDHFRKLCGVYPPRLAAGQWPQ